MVPKPSSWVNLAGRMLRIADDLSGIYSRGISTAGVWLGWLRYLLALVPPSAGAPLSGSSTR